MHMQDEVDFPDFSLPDFSWPWQTKTLLELVRNTGLLPEVNISGTIHNVCLIKVAVYIRDQILGYICRTL